MQITPLSTALVNINRYGDYTPGLSTAVALTDLFLKCAVRPFMSQAAVQNSHYFTYLDTKSIARCIVLLVPVIGNIFIACMDFYTLCQRERIISSIKLLTATLTPEKTLTLYHEACRYGSAEGHYKIAMALITGQGIKKDCKLGTATICCSD